MIVADTNLISYLLIEGDQTEAARKVWAKDPSWVMPPLWRSEFLNVLAVAYRAGVISQSQALVVWERAKTLFGGGEVEPSGSRALQLAMERGISACDAQFVSVAMDLGVSLVTADKRLLDKCQKETVSVEDFSSAQDNP